MAYRVKCVNTDNSSVYNDCRSIATIGIPRKGGGTNTYTPERIHDRIKGGEEFYVEYQGSQTYLDAVKEDDGTKYVRTEANDTTNDNLLQQPSC